MRNRSFSFIRTAIKLITVVNTVAATLTLPVFGQSSSPQSGATAPPAPAIQNPVAPNSAPASDLGSPPPIQSVRIRHKFHPGDVLVYSANISSSGVYTRPGYQSLGLQETASMILTETVKSVRETDGAASIVIKARSLHVTANNQTISSPSMLDPLRRATETFVLTPEGRIVSRHVANAGIAESLAFIDYTDTISLESGVQIPPDDATVGQSWKVSAKYLSKLGLYATAYGSLVGLQHENGKDIAQLHLGIGGQVSASGTYGTQASVGVRGNMDGSIDQTFDVTNGRLSSQSGTLHYSTNDTYGQPGASQNAYTSQNSVTLQIDIVTTTSIQLLRVVHIH